MSVKVESSVHKQLCVTMKIFIPSICKGWTCVSECVNADAGESQIERPCTYGVCDRLLGYIEILNVLLHTSQVYVYVHLTNTINFFLQLMCFLWVPSLPYFSIGCSVGQTCEICVSAKIPSQILGS
jgi:hypothetical protein